MSMNIKEILKTLKAAGSPENVAGMARYGIVTQSAYGASSLAIERLARKIGRDHSLAERLWRTGNLDARVLACFAEEPARVTAAQMERWVRDFDNWAICDGCCLHLFDRTRFAWSKSVQWSRRRPEFIRRAGFTLMAVLAVHDKQADDTRFLKLLPLIEAGATDERNYVRKAVNWALRSIGKRNSRLNRAAVRTAERIHKLDSRAARWIASDARRELTSGAVQRRLAAREKKGTQKSKDKTRKQGLRKRGRKGESRT
jgi:3-methyladenine DNA glycosylase AlkD